MLSILLCVLLPLPLPQDGAAAARTVTRNKVVPPGDWQAVIRQGKQRSQVMAHLDHLTNRIGPRLTSSDNLQNACEWARDYWKSIGYENARIEQWGTFPIGFNRGPSSGEIVAPKNARTSLVFITRAWSPGTRGRQEGPAMGAPRNLEEAKKLGAAMRGCWLVQHATGSGRFLARGARELARYCEQQGALGFIRSGSEFRRGTKLRNLLMTSGSYRIQWDRLPSFPSIQVRWDHFQAIAKLLDEGAGVRLAFDIRNHFKKGPIPLYNVIADLVGTDKPDEYVVVSGHLDSWDGATGTTDNGTGSATTIEAARILMAAGVKPKRTIRFMLWSGEEQGLMGSSRWVQKNRKDVRQNCQACLVHDGGTNYASGIRGSKEQMPVLARAFEGFAGIDPRFPFELAEGDQPSWGSDHASFVRVGAPGFYWQQDGRAVYRYTHHTQHDTFDAAIREYQAQTATVAALGALALANIEDRVPPPPPRSTFGVFLSPAMVVTKVDEGSMMQRAGVRKGDRLIELAGQKLKDRNALRPAVFSLFRAGGKGDLTVERNGERKTIRVDATRRRGGGRGRPAPAKPKKKRVIKT